MHKKSIALLAAYVLIFALCGCGMIVPMADNSGAETVSGANAPQTSDGKEQFDPYYVSGDYVYNIPDSQYSDGIYNIVRRARQMCEIQWTPLEDMTSWADEFVFSKNTVITGLPYGQPVYGGYVPWDNGFGVFVKSTADVKSVFYTERSTYGESAPFYSQDCSGFVSWAWQLRERTTTSDLGYFSYKVNEQSIDAAHVGDCLLRTGDDPHVVLITGLRIKDGKVVFAEISEATLPKTRVTRYGEGEILTVGDLTEKYLGDGYVLYRPNDTDSITYEHSCWCPLDGEYCAGCTASVLRTESTVSDGNLTGKIYSPDKIVSLTYRIDRGDYGSEKWRVGNDSGLNFREEPSTQSEITDFVPPGSEIFVYEIKTIDGDAWGKARFNGEIGWVWLGNAVKLSGTLERGSEISVNAVQTSSGSDLEVYSNCCTYSFVPDISSLESGIYKVTVTATDEKGVTAEAGSFTLYK